MSKRKRIIFIGLLSILFIFQASLITSARSGGGGGGGGGGGSSSAGRGGHSSSRGTSSPFGIIFGVSMIIFANKKDSIICKAKVFNKNREAKRLIKRLQKIDNSYSDYMLQNRVEETYFKMQEAWTNLNTEISKEYMSDFIYSGHTTKLSWMKLRNEKNILEKIKLLDAKPVGVEHYTDKSKDIVWFYIKGSMIDYIINEKSNEIIEGKTRNSSFVEFWKFIKVNDKWVVDIIRQMNEVDVKEDFNISSEQ